MSMLHLRSFGPMAILVATSLAALPASPPRAAMAATPQGAAVFGIVPPGAILPFGGDVAPPGYLLCDGTEVLQSDYPRLYAAIGTAYGTASPFTFTLPDLRGRFLRGVDGTAGNDPDSSLRTEINPGGNVGNNVGSLQKDGRRGFSDTFSGTTSAAGAHTHPIPTWNDDWDEDDGNSSVERPGWADDKPSGNYKTLNDTLSSGSHSHSFSLEVTFNGQAETRPKNVYVNYIIKF